MRIQLFLRQDHPARPAHFEHFPTLNKRRLGNPSESDIWRGSFGSGILPRD
jgi:hypothetical protein